METYPPPPQPAEIDLTPFYARIADLEETRDRLGQELEVSRTETAQYLAYLETANDLIYKTDAKGVFTYVNPAAEMVTGYTKEELIGRFYLELVRPGYQEATARTYGKQFVYKISNTYFEVPLMDKAGREVWVGQHVQLIMKEDQVTGFQAMARDITKQKQIEEALKKYQERLEIMVEDRTLELKKRNELLEQEILEREQAEADLRDSKERNCTILDAIQEGYFEVDLEGNFTFFNDMLSKIHGFSRDQLTGLNYRQYTDAENAEKTYKFFNSVYRTGRPLNGCQYEIMDSGGKRKILESSISLIKDSLGKPTGFRGIARDITELKRAQAALVESEERYRTIIETIEDGYYEVNPAGNLVFFNDALACIHEYPREEFMGKEGREYTDAENAQILYRGFKQVYRTGQSLKGLQYEVITKKGKKKNLETSVSLMRDRSGKSVGARGICRDITELKRAQTALWESEERYRGLIEASPDAIAVFDLAYKLLLINPKGLELFDYGDSKELIGESILKFVPGDELDPVIGDFQHILKTGMIEEGKSKYRTGEAVLIRKDGKRFPAEVRAAPVKGMTGETEGFIVVIRDISERKLNEDAFQKTQAKIALLLNSISSILVALSDDNRIIFWNTKAEEQFGVMEKEAMGSPLGDLGIPWDWNQVKAAISRCKKENTTVALDQLKFLQPDGKEGILGMRINPIWGEEFSGTVTLIHGANITKRKIMEGQLSQAHKLESIGQLAAGIAHEINTPTQYVGDNVRFLRTSFEELNRILFKYAALKEGIKTGLPMDDLLREVEETLQEADFDYLAQEIPLAFQQTLEGLERVSRIVQSMKAFAHPGNEEKEAVDINKAIENTSMVARNEWKYVADLVTDLDPSLPLVHCIPGDINQVILNILVNAAHAISEVNGDGPGGKGKISISTHQDEHSVEIRIRDSGKGIPPEIRSRIFDPFFTTKDVGKGTGQGLAISHTAIVERHNGSLTFDSEIGQGTTFKIRLPKEEPSNAGNQKA